jgi:hypothetical protein
MLPIINLLITNSVQRTVARSKRNGIFIAAAAVLLITAYAFGVAALAIWLARIYGAIDEALIMCAGALLLAVILVVTMVIINKREEQRTRERRMAMESMAATALGLVRAQPLLTAALAAAFVLANLVGPSKRRD